MIPLSESRKEASASSAPESVPLSVSHPTLWNAMTNTERDSNIAGYQELVQSCTVDVEKHKRLEEHIQLVSETLAHKHEKVVRLQKEHEQLVSENKLFSELNANLLSQLNDLKDELKDFKASASQGEKLFYEKGFVEGQKQTLQKIKEVIGSLDALPIDAPMGRHHARRERQRIASKLGLFEGEQK